MAEFPLVDNGILVCCGAETVGGRWQSHCYDQHHRPAGSAASAVLRRLRRLCRSDVPHTVQPWGAITQTVAGLRGTLWAARPAGELLDTVCAIESLRSLLDAVLVEVVTEIDATGAAKAAGWASTADFLTALTGGRKGSGKALTRLAHAVSTDHPRLGQAMAAGTLSRTQALVILDALDRLPVHPGLRDAAEQLLVHEAQVRDATRPGQGRRPRV